MFTTFAQETEINAKPVNCQSVCNLNIKLMQLHLIDRFSSFNNLFCSFLSVKVLLRKLNKTHPKVMTNLLN
jgi:hypothetical protein